MRTWSIPIGRLFGADMRIHLSFLFLVVFVLIPAMEYDKTGVTAEQSLILAGIIFASVLVHEIGHAVMARLRGVPLRLVMLLPIGGVHLRDGDAGHPLTPKQEIPIALAGPLTSLAVAAVAAVAVVLSRPDVALMGAPFVSPKDPLKSLIWVNTFLGALNLVPAYPLDAGRILRSVLAMEKGSDHHEATRRAVMMGQVFATVLIFAGIWTPWLMLVGFFLFVAVQLEDRSLVFQAVMQSVRLEDVMLTDFATLSPADTLEDALHKAVHTLQDDFPVIRGSDMVGVISRQRIIEALRDEGNGYVQSVMNRAFEASDRRESLAAAFRKITNRGATLIPVVEENRLVGIVTLQNLMHSMGLLAESRRLRRHLRQDQSED